MIKGIGIDIIELNRILNSIQQHNKRLADRILTHAEKALFETFTNERRRVEYLAGRFAAKEAFSKAVGSGIGKLSFQDIEIFSDTNGAPKMSIAGYEDTRIFISITHSKDYAVAQVVLEEKN